MFEAVLNSLVLVSVVFVGIKLNKAVNASMGCGCRYNNVCKGCPLHQKIYKKTALVNQSNESLGSD